jgi:hypothetical protein
MMFHVEHHIHELHQVANLGESLERYVVWRTLTDPVQRADSLQLLNIHRPK